MDAREMVTATCNEIDKINFILGFSQKHAGRIMLSDQDDALLEESVNTIRGYIPQLLKVDIKSIYESCNHDEYIQYIHQISNYVSEVAGIVSRSKSNKYIEQHTIAV